MNDDCEWYLCDATPTTEGFFLIYSNDLNGLITFCKVILCINRNVCVFPEENGSVGVRKGIFPVERIRKDDVRTEQENMNEYFGMQIYGMLNATIICNYYYRNPETRDPVFAYSKKLRKK